MRQAVWCCALFLLSSNLHAQNVEHTTYFIGSSFALNHRSDNILAYDGSTKCGVFTTGDKNAFNFFAGANLPLSRLWSITAKAEYRDFSTSFDDTPDSALPSIYLAQGNYTNVKRQRVYDATVHVASISGLVSYALFPALHLSGGLFSGYFLKHSYSESEKLLSPSNARYAGTFLTHRDIVNNGNVSVPSFTGGLEFEASYELPFQPHVSMRPSVGVTIPFQAILDNGGPLHLLAPTASLAFVYHPPVKVQEQPPQLVWDSLLVAPTPSTAAKEEKKKSMLSVSIKALGIDQDGREVGEPVLSIERVHVTEVYPMLHYVFFDDGSAEIPARYHRTTPTTRSSFDERALYTANALDIHHNVLDILGHRLAASPKASITIVGSRSEHSPLDSAKGIAIASGRAEAVRDYLASVWGISPSRLHIKARGLPEIASDDHNPYGEAENRRVEIIPSSADVTAPLWTERIERVATPPRIDFDPEITTSTGVGIKSASIIVKQGDRVLRTFDALADDSVAADYSWTLDERSMPERRDSLMYVFRVVDSLGETAEASGVIHLRSETHDITKHETDTALDRMLERYSLILFDYSSSQLDRKESDRIVRNMASAIHPTSSIRLTGHTDQTGDDAFNDKLSHERVTRAVSMLESALKQLGKSKPEMDVESRGSRDQLFDNSIPEGRVLSRTVRALIESDTK